MTLNGEKKRTRAIKRGGQHPEWDEEVRFVLYEDTEVTPPPTRDGNGTPTPPPPKDSKRKKKVKGGNAMKVACFADDPKDPEIIGETTVDLAEVLSKGETDGDHFVAYAAIVLLIAFLRLVHFDEQRQVQWRGVP